MVDRNVNDTPDLYREGYTELLGECDGEWGLCCSLDDEFIRDLGHNLYEKLTVHARGVGRRNLTILSVQGDVLRALDLDNSSVLLVPVCSIYLFYDAEPLSIHEGAAALIRLDGGGSCRGCYGMMPELKRYIGKTVNVRLPDGEMTLSVTEVVGLTLRGVSGDARVSMRIDCIDAMEIPGAVTKT